jgi:hypothetical protein
VKALLLALMLTAACAAPPSPEDAPAADTADAGIAVIHQPFGVRNANLKVIMGINFHNPWDEGLLGHVPPLATWACSGWTMYMGAIAASETNLNNHEFLAEQALAGPSAIHTGTAGGQCAGGPAVIKRCEYRFTGVNVPTDADIVVWMWPNCPTSRAEGPRRYRLTPGQVGTAYQDLAGPMVAKQQWKERLCDTGCGGCGGEWYGNDTVVSYRQCTPSGGACHEPCTIYSATW